MRDWSVGCNNIYYTAQLYLEEVPAVLYYFEMFICWICDNLPLWTGFHRYIHIPIFNLLTRHTKLIQTIDIPYFTAKKMFPNEHDWNDEYLNDDGSYEYPIYRDKALELSNEFDMLYNKIEERGNVRI